MLFSISVFCPSVVFAYMRVFVKQLVFTVSPPTPIEGILQEADRRVLPPTGSSRSYDHFEIQKNAFHQVVTGFTNKTPRWKYTIIVSKLFYCHRFIRSKCHLYKIKRENWLTTRFVHSFKMEGFIWTMTQKPWITLNVKQSGPSVCDSIPHLWNKSLEHKSVSTATKTAQTLNWLNIIHCFDTRKYYFIHFISQMCSF